MRPLSGVFYTASRPGRGGRDRHTRLSASSSQRPSLLDGQRKSLGQPHPGRGLGAAPARPLCTAHPSPWRSIAADRVARAACARARQPKPCRCWNPPPCTTRPGGSVRADLPRRRRHRTGSRHLLTLASSACCWTPACSRAQDPAQAQLDGLGPAALAGRRAAVPPGPLRLPVRAAAQGFKGPIYATTATRATSATCCSATAPTCREEDARRANKRGQQPPRTALPLYSVRGRATLKQFAPLPRDGWLRLAPPTSGHALGHLLGASSIHVSQGGRSLLFSGDIGRVGDLLMPVPRCRRRRCRPVESTYGNRLHPPRRPGPPGARSCCNTFKRGGSVLLPSFAVGRAQGPAAAAATPAQRRRAAAGRADLAGQPHGRAGHRTDREARRLLRISASEAQPDRPGALRHQAGPNCVKLAATLAPRAKPSGHLGQRHDHRRAGAELHRDAGAAGPPPHRLPRLPGRRHARCAHGGRGARDQGAAAAGSP